MKEPYIIIENLLSPAQCKLLVDYGVHNMARLATQSDANPRYNGNTLRIEEIDSLEVKAIMISALHRTRKVISAMFDVPAVFLDLSSISCWATGTELGAHADNIYWDTMQPNYVPNRTHSSVLYLNDNYKGGEFRWWDKTAEDKIEVARTIAPSAGSVIAFKSDINYIHSVERINDGTRWTVPMWFTDSLKYVPERYQTAEYLIGI